MTIQYGKSNICWGCDEKWARLPISNIPEAAIKIRRRIRSKNVARAFVKYQNKIEDWYLEQDGENAVKLGMLKSVNSF